MSCNFMFFFSFVASCNIFFSSFLFLIIFFSLRLLPVAAFEFDVGDDDGWKVPPSDKLQFYNSWASKKRFQVGDTLIFEYKKDSLMVVNAEDYSQCNSSHPIFFSNNGHTDFKLDESGPFYFISGVSGHCERGQKMIVKVLGQSPAPRNSPSPPGGGSINPPGSTKSDATVPMTRITYIVISRLVISVLGFLLH
ncbi:early nodulin-like protein 21 [Magnolia sinica]|uniref:early nodulin-like protein 21 n=1 Tax=Magnolia sinica TaxID=86752 RepID=UPI00265805E7|nr:early nodulin-like protein 21 [Magnolia sinica]